MSYWKMANLFHKSDFLKLVENNEVSPTNIYSQRDKTA